MFDALSHKEAWVDMNDAVLVDAVEFVGSAAVLLLRVGGESAPVFGIEDGVVDGAVGAGYADVAGDDVASGVG